MQQGGYLVVAWKGPFLRDSIQGRGGRWESSFQSVVSANLGKGVEVSFCVEGGTSTWKERKEELGRSNADPQQVPILKRLRLFGRRQRGNGCERAMSVRRI